MCLHFLHFTVSTFILAPFTLTKLIREILNSLVKLLYSGDILSILQFLVLAYQRGTQADGSQDSCFLREVFMYSHTSPLKKVMRLTQTMLCKHEYCEIKPTF